MSWSKMLGRYLYSRFPATQFVPLAVFVATAGLAPAPPEPLARWIMAVMLSFMLILQFRLWDDIADRERDRLKQPERVLCRTSDIKPFLIAATILPLINGILLAWYQGHINWIPAYLLLCASLLAWYRLRPSSASPGLLNSALVLLKYPFIAWLVSTAAEDPVMPLIFSCLFSVYLIFIIFEILDDPALGQQHGAISGLLTSLGLLLCIWVFIPIWTRPSAGYVYWLAWGLIVLGTLALGLSGFFELKERDGMRKRRGFFLLGLLAYLTLAIERSP